MNAPRRIRQAVFFSLLFVPGCFVDEAFAIDISIPISTPRLTGVAAEIPVGSLSVLLEANLRYDARGKIVGDATIDGVPTTVKGSLKRSGDGFAYTVTLAGTTAKVSLKLSGVVGSGVASVKYAGPRGKARLASFPVNLLTAAEASGGVIAAEVFVDARGKITGTGRFSSGLGNDPEAAGAIKGKFSGTTLSLSFKAGKQKISFKGSLQGNAFVGKLKIKAPPAKEVVESFSVPLGDGLELPFPDGGGDSDGAQERPYKFIALESASSIAYFGGGLSINDVTTRSGRQTRWGWVDISNGTTYLRNEKEIEFSTTALLPPAATGTWFTTTVYTHTYDMRENRLRKGARFGTCTLAVTAVDGDFISGTWEVRSDNGSQVATGPWQTTQRPDAGF